MFVYWYPELKGRRREVVSEGLKAEMTTLAVALRSDLPSGTRGPGVFGECIYPLCLSFSLFLVFNKKSRLGTLGRGIISPLNATLVLGRARRTGWHGSWGILPTSLHPLEQSWVPSWSSSRYWTAHRLEQGAKDYNIPHLLAPVIMIFHR